MPGLMQQARTSVVLPKGRAVRLRRLPRLFPGLKAYIEGSRAVACAEGNRDERPVSLTDEGLADKVMHYGSTIAPFISSRDLKGRDSIAVFLDDEPETMKESYHRLEQAQGERAQGEAATDAPRWA